jgi:hypothetical protein
MAMAANRMAGTGSSDRLEPVDICYVATSGVPLFSVLGVPSGGCPTLGDLIGHAALTLVPAPATPVTRTPRRLLPRRMPRPSDAGGKVCGVVPRGAVARVCGQRIDGATGRISA